MVLAWEIRKVKTRCEEDAHILEKEVVKLRLKKLQDMKENTEKEENILTQIPERMIEVEQSTQYSPSGTYSEDEDFYADLTQY